MILFRLSYFLDTNGPFSREVMYWITSFVPRFPHCSRLSYSVIDVKQIDIDYKAEIISHWREFAHLRVCPKVEIHTFLNGLFSSWILFLQIS